MSIPPYQAFQKALKSDDVKKIEQLLQTSETDKLLHKYMICTNDRPLSYLLKKNKKKFIDTLYNFGVESTHHDNFNSARSKNEAGKRHRMYNLVNIFKNNDIEHALQIIFTNQVDHNDVIEAAIISENIEVLKELLTFNFPISSLSLTKLEKITDKNIYNKIFQLLQSHTNDYQEEITDQAAILNINNNRKIIPAWEYIAGHTRVESLKDQNRVLNSLEEFELKIQNEHNIESLAALTSIGLKAAEGKFIMLFANSDNLLNFTLNNSNHEITAKPTGITSICGLPKLSNELIELLNTAFIESACKFMGRKYQKSTFTNNVLFFININKNKINQHKINLKPLETELKKIRGR